MPDAEQESLVRALSATGAVAGGLEAAGLSGADVAMLAYAAKLTRTPEAIEAADVDALRAHGFDDRAIHDICAVTAYYAFVNRIADGLGVELEDGRGGPPPGDGHGGSR